MKNTQNKIVRRVARNGGLALVSLLALNGCKQVVTETEYVDRPVEVEKEVPTYPEITTKVRLLDGQVTVKCPGDLMESSLDKLNKTMIDIELACGGNPTADTIIRGAVSKGVTIVVGNGNDYEANGKVISVNAEWLKNNDAYSVVAPMFAHEIRDIGDNVLLTMAPASKSMDLGREYSDAKNTVRLSFGKSQTQKVIGKCVVRVKKSRGCGFFLLQRKRCLAPSRLT
jgi:hypothetical protein